MFKLLGVTSKQEKEREAAIEQRQREIVEKQRQKESEAQKKQQEEAQKQREAVQARAAGVNPESLATVLAHQHGINALITLPDGRLASASMSDNLIKLWNVSTGRCEVTFDHPSVKVLTALPDGRLASGAGGIRCNDEDSLIKIWDLTRGTGVATFSGHEYPINDLAVLPGGRLASASDVGPIKIWDLTSGVCVATLSLSEQSKGVCALKMLPDGRLASGHWKGSINIWDLTRKTCVSTLTGHRDRANGLILLPNGGCVNKPPFLTGGYFLNQLASL